MDLSLLELTYLAILVGLLLSLRVRRRRVWLRFAPAGPAAADASPGEGGQPRRTVVTAGGLARTDADSFAEEFHQLLGPLQPDVSPPQPAPEE